MPALRRRARKKLLLLATLAYAFLLSQLEAPYDFPRLWLQRYYAHRSGQHCRAAKLPLTRLRCSLSRLWQDLLPNFVALATPLMGVHVSEVV